MSARESASVRFILQQDGSVQVEHRHAESWAAMEAVESMAGPQGLERLYRCPCGEEVIAVEASKQ